MYTYT